MAKKQKIKSRFPSLKEKHLPGGFNWVGTGTEIYDRIGLNYKGGVGTEQYWLPKNRLDLAAFKHDLAYYATDNLSRLAADKEFIKMSGQTVSSTLADAAIFSQLSFRAFGELSKEFGGILLTPAASRRAYKDLVDLFITPIIAKRPSMANWLLKKKVGVAPKSVKAWFLKHLGIKGSKTGPTNRKNVEKIMIARLLTVGSFLLTDAVDAAYKGAKYVSKGLSSIPVDIDSFNKLWDDAFLFLTPLSYFNKNEKAVHKKLELVFKKYEDYLKTVGKFEDSGKPTFGVNIEIFDKNFNVQKGKREISGNGEFILTNKGNKAAYKEFFKEFTGYIKTVNKYNPADDKYPLPTLNRANIKLVVDGQPPAIPKEIPTIIPLGVPKDTTAVQEKPNAAIIDILSGKEKVFNLLDFAQTSQPTTTPRAAPKQLNPAITSILAGENKVVNLLDFAI